MSSRSVSEAQTGGNTSYFFPALTGGNTPQRVGTGEQRKTTGGQRKMSHNNERQQRKRLTSIDPGPAATIPFRRATKNPSAEHRKPAAQHRKTVCPASKNLLAKHLKLWNLCRKTIDTFFKPCKLASNQMNLCLAHHVNHVIMVFANRGRCAPPPPQPPHLFKPRRLAPKHMKLSNPSCDHCAANGGA